MKEALTIDSLLNKKIRDVTVEDIIKTWIIQTGNPRIKSEEILVRLSNSKRYGRAKVMTAIAYVANHM